MGGKKLKAKKKSNQGRQSVLKSEGDRLEK